MKHITTDAIFEKLLKDGITVFLYCTSAQYRGVELTKKDGGINIKVDINTHAPDYKNKTPSELLLIAHDLFYKTCNTCAKELLQPVLEAPKSSFSNDDEEPF